MAVVLACLPASGVAFEQKAMLLHQPVDALGIDRGQTVGSPLALEERGDPPVPVCRTLVDKRRISTASSTSPGRSCGPRCGLLRSRRSTTFERTTPGVVLTVFTGYLPEAGRATARPFFCPRQVASLRISTSIWFGKQRGRVTRLGW
jgi:hypothetical protein